MSEHAPTGPDPLPPHPSPSGRTTWRSRLYAARAVTAVALAGLVLGGLGGVAVGYAGDDATSGPGGPGRGDLPGQPGRHGVPGHLDDGPCSRPDGSPPAAAVPPGTAARDDVRPDATT